MNATLDQNSSGPRLRVGLVGIGKMGLSHHAVVNTHPDAELAGVCDSSSLMLRTLKKYTGVATYSNADSLIRNANLDAVIIATPSSSHASIARQALDNGLHVFCEKPLTLDPAVSSALADLGESKGLVTQVGYHNRFVAAFQEAKRLLDLGAIGEVTHALGQAHGSVVTKPKGSTWRSQRSEGGGCLYDYAAHVIDLLSWYLGEPESVGGSNLRSTFSRDTDDEVSSTLNFVGGRTAQLLANWSDDSVRKMTMSVTLWGTTGRIFVDRQECQVFLRDNAKIPVGYKPGWTVKYTTELTEPVWFYLRGEEYSAQVDNFIRRGLAAKVDGMSTFATAAVTDRVISMIKADATGRLAPDFAVPSSAETESQAGRTRRRVPRSIRKGRR